MKEGDLGDAVRASMSFPFMFKPIEIDNVLAYDGGIYNNFPTDVMRDDFHPDVIIGSVVSTNPTKPKENDLMSQIENMVMQKTDYSIPDSMGILMTFKYDNVNLMDFQRIDELHDIVTNLELMDNTIMIASIKFRQRMGAIHYLTLTGNYGLTDSNFFDILKGKQLFGVSAGYGMDSIFGPLEISLGYSNQTDKGSCFVNLGYYF